MPDWGVSFLPGAQEPGAEGQQGRPAAGRNPLQEAVKILSLRLPKFYGSGSIAPAPLLNAPGGMGQPGARGNVTAQAFAQMAGLPPGMAMPQAPAQMLSPPLPSAGGSGTTEGWMGQERGLQPPRAPMGGQPAPLPPPQEMWSPPPPRFVPGNETGEGGAASPPFTPPGPWVDPRPDTSRENLMPPPPPLPAMSSPWEQPGRNQTLARKWLGDDWDPGY